MKLIEEKYGGVEALEAEWEVKSAEFVNFPTSRNRSTIYSWLEKGIPIKQSDSLQVFGLCSLLDVDPLAVLDFEANGFFTNFSAIRKVLYLSPKQMKGFAPLLEMYRPGEVWPSREIAVNHYGRDWFAKEFTNVENWKNTDYVLVKAIFARPAGAAPRALHVAYRRFNTNDTMWRFYGTVVASEGKLNLYSEGGDHQHMSQMEVDEIRFRTYFGGRPVEWKLASLHQFELLDPVFPYNDPDVIGFTW